MQQLARDLAGGEISLPSFPAVVVKIRELLEDDDCDFSQVSHVVSADAVLVSRLFVFANSSYHNRSGEKVTNLDDAIARLGIELVRNTALSLAVKQLLLAEKHKAVLTYLRAIWANSMRLASLSYAIAERNPRLNEETAFMCGLLHEIGMLYILTKAKDFPEFLGDEATLRDVLNNWHGQVGRCIVEAWGFPEAVVRSMDPAEFLDEHTHLEPDFVDTVYVANRLLSTAEDEWSLVLEEPAAQKLDIDADAVDSIKQRFTEKLATVQQSLS